MTILLFIVLFAGAVFWAFLMVIDAFVPSWRWVVPFIAAAWAALGYVWFEHAEVTSRPGHDAKVGETLGVAIASAGTIGVVIGTIIYAAIVVRREGRHKAGPLRELTREEMRKLLD
jgi:hypothetical protein